LPWTGGSFYSAAEREVTQIVWQRIIGLSVAKVPLNTIVPALFKQSSRAKLRSRS